MGYFTSDNKKDTYKDLDRFLKENNYSFGYRELALSIYWIDFICSYRKKIARMDLIQKELESLIDIRFQYKKHSQQKHLTDYDPFKSIPKNLTYIATEIGQKEKISKRIKELEFYMLLEPLKTIKVSPRNLIILVWGYAFKKIKESLDWELMENLYSWFRERKIRTNLASIFSSNKTARKTLQRMYYKHTIEKNFDSEKQKNFRDLISFIYNKSFIRKEIETGIKIPTKKKGVRYWQ